MPDGHNKLQPEHMQACSHESGTLIARLQGAPLALLRRLAQQLHDRGAVAQPCWPKTLSDEEEMTMYALQPLHQEPLVQSQDTLTIPCHPLCLCGAKVSHIMTQGIWAVQAT